MADVTESPGEIAADYQTIARLVEVTTPGFTIIAQRDPKRVYIRFWLPSGVLASILPEPGQNVVATFTNDNVSGSEYHLRDCPSLVTGEWYAFIGGGIGQVYVVECVYMR